ncbi:hypothetical protein LWI28_006529 [Acer negundo]|uniref:Protein kinase domain-containing protein n=1 Tax=Acer negundo TaxID=4023 RepID=A0AAD5NKJ0_ACENE|nr:hypothetical protein LWI28_006529 [Acer negundo]
MASAGSSSAAESQISVVEENPNGQISGPPCLKEFSFADLKTATSNFGHKALLGEGAHGRVYIGWFDEKTLSRPSESGIGMAVAIKIYYPETIQAFDQWQVMSLSYYLRIYGLELPLEQLENYNPKLSDFGLAKLGPSGDKTHVTTRMMGTEGYVAPEYFESGHLNAKSDVYSFGIVLLELLTGLRAVDLRRTNDNLVEWLKPMLSQLKTLMDVQMVGQYSLGAACNATQLTLKCLEVNHKDRPSTKDVLEELTATNNFKPEALLGEGGYGRVYKGWIDEKTLTPSEWGTGMAVAIKLWNPETVQVFEQWQEMPLKHYLGIYGLKLPLEQLEKYNPKISDLGLAKLGPSGDKTHVKTRMMGTDGYAAPEYIRHLTAKSDVYSFGVVLLELLMGFKAVGTRRRKEYLVEWLKPMLSQNRKLQTIMGVWMEGQHSSEATSQTAQLILKCLSIDPEDRPSMKEVMEVLVQIQALTFMKKVPEVSEKINKAMEEKPPRCSIAPPRHGQPCRFLTSLKASCQNMSLKTRKLFSM